MTRGGSGTRAVMKSLNHHLILSLLNPAVCLVHFLNVKLSLPRSISFRYVDTILRHGAPKFLFVITKRALKKVSSTQS